MTHGETYAAEVNIIKTDRFRKSERNTASIIVEQGDEPGVNSLEAGFVGAVGESRTGAFCKGRDSIDPSNLKEPLQQRAVGKTDAKSPVLRSGGMAGDVAAQGTHATLAEVLSLFRALLAKINLTMLHGELDKLMLKA
ncbi:MAG: hypothetical protein H7A51_18105 [Akkermansiaceae bacterium]|nr:hypothetical protein [Akkermansiaceae bacterium]